MTEFQHITRLHESTVQDPKPFFVKARVTNKSMRSVSMKVDARVWKVALKLAKGDRSRLIVRDETTVSVVNKSQRKPTGIL